MSKRVKVNALVHQHDRGEMEAAFSLPDMKKIDSSLRKGYEQTISIFYKHLQKLNKDKSNKAALVKDIIKDLTSTTKQQPHKDTYAFARAYILFSAPAIPDLRLQYVFDNAFYDEMLDSGTSLTGYVCNVYGLNDLYLIGEQLILTKIKKRSLTIAESRAMVLENKFIQTIDWHRRHEQPILIIGATGTSKEAMATVIYKLSKRRNAGYKAINCVAISENLIESELFGHVKGSFTDAKADKKGIFELSKGGTVFLDELGKTSIPFQIKILRAIEQKQIMRVGSGELIDIDVRIIASIQPSDLQKEPITFLPDLYWRFRHKIMMPLLKDRLFQLKDSEYHHEIFNISLSLVLSGFEKHDEITISKDAYILLKSHDYAQGNYRELETVLSEAVMNAQIAKRTKILPEDITFTTTGDNTSTKETVPQEESYKNIPFNAIFAYADKARASIVKKKIQKMLKSGKDLKTTLIHDEHIPEKDYQKYQKKIKTYTGMGIRELSKTNPT